MSVTDGEIKSMMEDVAQNAANISIIMNAIEDQKGATAKILSYIENDPTTGRLGLFATLQQHGNRIEIIEDSRANDKTKQKAYIGVATVLGGIIMSLVTFFFKLIIGK